jgi:hypothetical protein
MDALVSCMVNAQGILGMDVVMWFLIVDGVRITLMI